MLFQYISIIVLTLLSAFFSGSETAYASSSEMKLKRNSEKGTLVSKTALTIKERFEDALITILLCNNLVNIAASSIATIIAISLFGENGTWIATIAMTIILLIFGEIAPKVIANSIPESFARIVAMPLSFLMFIFKPIVFTTQKLVSLFSHIWKSNIKEGPSVTEDDLESIIDTVEDEGVMDEESCDLLQSALDFDEVLAYEIITPRVDMTALDIDDPADENIEKALSSMFSRIPVYKDTIDNIIGILHLNHLLKRLVDERENLNLRDLLMPVSFVHKTMALPDVLAVMRKRKCHMVVVTDEYGGTMGVLTMEDVLEQLVGDIWDETDEIISEFQETGVNIYEADGAMRIYDFFEELDLDDRDFDDDNATLGGWAIEMLGGYPRVGQSFDYKNLTITVIKRQKLRVRRLKVVVHPLLDN
ncbi:MAG: HlyC/CorC family transporter, partial [Clostridia bacterium]|nr:HlyC/CorC family transporter [Clostridia bacterium]